MRIKSLLNTISILFILCTFTALLPNCSSDSMPEYFEELDFEFCGSIKREVYHIKKCIHAWKILPDNLVQWHSVNEVTSSGRRPCSFCLPRGIIDDGAEPSGDYQYH